MRKRLISCLVFGLVLLSLATSAFADINSFIGSWKNVDANTRGITKLHIGKQGDILSMQAWGKCHPQDCDWGTVPSYAYGPGVSSTLAHNTEAVSAVFTPGHAETLVIIQRAPNNRIRAEVLTRFTDGSGRANHRSLYTFARERRVVAPLQEDRVARIRASGICANKDCRHSPPGHGFRVKDKRLQGSWTFSSESVR
jgi:hypothetical protein